MHGERDAPRERLARVVAHVFGQAAYVAEHHVYFLFPPKLLDGDEGGGGAGRHVNVSEGEAGLLSRAVLEDDGHVPHLPDGQVGSIYASDALVAGPEVHEVASMGVDVPRAAAVHDEGEMSEIPVLRTTDGPPLSGLSLIHI